VNRTERRKEEVRERILQAAFDLFLIQGVTATTIEDICTRADVANRTFFNHFATRQDMVRALAERRLLNLHDVVSRRVGGSARSRLVRTFDDIAATLVKSGDTYREIIGEMFASTGYGVQRGFGLQETFLELVEDGVARGEFGTKHDPQILADIVVGGLFVAIMNWTTDKTYSLKGGLHQTAVALIDVLSADVADSAATSSRG
jgi:AcrR family transcriptional regulator